MAPSLVCVQFFIGNIHRQQTLWTVPRELGNQQHLYPGHMGWSLPVVRQETLCRGREGCHRNSGGMSSVLSPFTSPSPSLSFAYLCITSKRTTSTSQRTTEKRTYPSGCWMNPRRSQNSLATSMRGRCHRTPRLQCTKTGRGWAMPASCWRNSLATTPSANCRRSPLLWVSIRPNWSPISAMKSSSLLHRWPRKTSTSNPYGYKTTNERLWTSIS